MGLALPPARGYRSGPGDGGAAAYELDVSVDGSRGLGGVDRAASGIPTEAEYVAAYCRRMGLKEIPDWTFLIAFSFFRIAAIAQGVYKRALDGNASNPERGRKMGAAVPLMAKLAMETVENG